LACERSLVFYEYSTTPLPTKLTANTYHFWYDKEKFADTRHKLHYSLHVFLTGLYGKNNREETQCDVILETIEQEIQPLMSGYYYAWEVDKDDIKKVSLFMTNISIQHYFVSDLRQLVLRFPPYTKLTAMIWLKYCESGVKHHNPNTANECSLLLYFSGFLHQ
jgi:hypothetical protein